MGVRAIPRRGHLIKDLRPMSTDIDWFNEFTILHCKSVTCLCIWFDSQYLSIFAACKQFIRFSIEILTRVYDNHCILQNPNSEEIWLTEYLISQVTNRYQFSTHYLGALFHYRFLKHCTFENLLYLNSINQYLTSKTTITIRKEQKKIQTLRNPCLC